MKRNSKSRSRRLTLLTLSILLPVMIGCEAILDFDRTPLQPVIDASMDETGSSSGTTPPKKDSGKPTGDDDDDDMDAGKDAGKDAGIKDAGDAGDANQ